LEALAPPDRTAFSRPSRRLRRRRPACEDAAMPGDPAASREAVAALVHAYAERLDAGDLAGVAALFADADYGAERGPLRRGAAEVLAALRAAIVLHDGKPCTRHVVTNLTIEVDEIAATATARSYFTVFQATATLPLQAILAGRYHDRFARADGRWRFAARRIHLDLLGELREHVRRPPPA
jgi:3-phenylpropionate/cinnamic acid dioxygenase small subunit